MRVWGRSQPARALAGVSATGAAGWLGRRPRPGRAAAGVAWPVARRARSRSKAITRLTGLATRGPRVASWSRWTAAMTGAMVLSARICTSSSRCAGQRAPRLVGVGAHAGVPSPDVLLGRHHGRSARSSTPSISCRATPDFRSPTRCSTAAEPNDPHLSRESCPGDNSLSKSRSASRGWTSPCCGPPCSCNPRGRVQRGARARTADDGLLQAREGLLRGLPLGGRSGGAGHDQ
jgi:hypothetical protein